MLSTEPTVKILSGKRGRKRVITLEEDARYVTTLPNSTSKLPVAKDATSAVN